jgi:hypothetical protein
MRNEASTVVAANLFVGSIGMEYAKLCVFDLPVATQFSHIHSNIAIKTRRYGEDNMLALVSFLLARSSGPLLALQVS